MLPTDPYKADQEFIERLNKQPHLRTRMEEILNIVENSSSNLIKADDAERKAIEELRKLGNEVMQGWANNRISDSVDELKNTEEVLRNKGKKN